MTLWLPEAELGEPSEVDLGSGHNLGNKQNAARGRYGKPQVLCHRQMEDALFRSLQGAPNQTTGGGRGHREVPPGPTHGCLSALTPATTPIMILPLDEYPRECHKPYYPITQIRENPPFASHKSGYSLIL